MNRFFTILSGVFCACILTVPAANATDSGTHRFPTENFRISDDGKSIVSSREKLSKVDRLSFETEMAFTQSPERVKRVKAVKKVSENDDEPTIEGTWEFTFGDYYMEDSHSFGKAYKVDYLATLQGNFVTFTDQSDAEEPMVAELDETAGTLTFARQYVREDRFIFLPFYIFQEPFVFNTLTNQMDFQSIVAKYDAEGGTITFEPENGMAWIAYGDKLGTDEIDMGFACDLEGAVQTSAGSGGNSGTIDDWMDAGKAVFMDGWVLPAYGINQWDERYWYEVDLQQSESNKKLYRLVNPYKSGPVASQNPYQGDGYLTFDVTDPEHVLINPYKESAGWANPSAKITEFYPYNALVFTHNYTGLDYAHIIAALDEETIAYTKFKDGVVSLGYVDYEENGLTQREYDANFGYQLDVNGGANWGSGANAPDMSAKIFLPEAGAGVEGVTIDSDNSKPVYFNLNGQRVENPENGIFIVKKGSQVKKVIK